MVEGARLESVYRGDSIVGSNPTVSAIEKAPALGAFSMAAMTLTFAVTNGGISRDGES